MIFMMPERVLIVNNKTRTLKSLTIAQIGEFLERDAESQTTKGLTLTRTALERLTMHTKAVIDRIRCDALTQ